MSRDVRVSQEQSTRIAQQLLADLAAGVPSQRIAALFSADVQFDIPGDQGAFPWIGKRTGRDAVAAFIDGTRLLLERVRFDVRGLLADHDAAVIFGELVS